MRQTEKEQVAECCCYLSVNAFYQFIGGLIAFYYCKCHFLQLFGGLNAFFIAIVNFYNILMDLMRFTTEIVTLQIIGGLIFKA